MVLLQGRCLNTLIVKVLGIYLVRACIILQEFVCALRLGVVGYFRGGVHGEIWITPAMALFVMCTK